MKKPLNIKKFLLPNIPYVFIALFATKLGQAWRLAPGTDFSGKALHLMEGFAAAFRSALPIFKKASGDRQILAKQLNISPHQLSYVTQSAEGEGLLFYGSVILPFVDRFPKDTELYKIITTKLSDLSEQSGEEAKDAITV